MDFFNHLRSRMLKTSFLFPQKHEEEQHHCNEPYYRKLLFLEVSGVVRLAALNQPIPPPIDDTDGS